MSNTSPVTAFQHAGELIDSRDLAGPTDLYRALLTVKNGFTNGVTTLSCYSFTKAEIKRAGIEWSFVVQSCEVLGLKLVNRAGHRGHDVTR